MYVTQDEDKQLTVVNPAVALRVALLQGIYGLFYFLLRINTQTHTSITAPLCHMRSFRFHISVFISIQFFLWPSRYQFSSRSSLNSVIPSTYYV